MSTMNVQTVGVAAILLAGGLFYYQHAKNRLLTKPKVEPMAEDRSSAVWYSPYNTGDPDAFVEMKLALMSAAIFQNNSDSITQYQRLFEMDETFVPWDGGFLYSEQNQADYRTGISN